jgi:hypothetical protein
MDKPSELVDYWITRLQTPGPGVPTFAAVMYGDQMRIDKTPTVCVAASTARSDGGSQYLDWEVPIFFLVYHGQVQDTQNNQRQCDQLAEALRDFLHTDPQAGGNVIHGWVTTMEPGWATRSRTLMRMHRLTWTCRARTVNPFGA